MNSLPEEDRRSSAPEGDWKSAWQPVIDRIGDELAGDEIAWGVDHVEAGIIRRYLEPLEFDCALHYDAETARANGYADIVAPYSSLSMFALPAVWQPGEVQFSDESRNAQPVRLSVRSKPVPGAPPTSGFFVTEFGAEYVRAVCVGERLGVRGQRVVACVPKETKVGRGAFVTFDSEVVDERGETVVRARRTVFLYNPHPEGAR